MSRPLIATYRLQFREGTGFSQAEGLVPYLKTLGASHLYASPVFAASPGSTHGYDVVDYNRFEEELGGDAGLGSLSDQLMKADLGLILDFVPNHMGVSQENRWWEDVLRWGRESRYAQTFDISWDEEKILIPTLGTPYGEALRGGALEVVYDEDRGEVRFSANGYGLPVDPRTLSHVFSFVDHPERDSLVRRFSAAVPADGEELGERFAEHVADPAFLAALKAGIEALNADRNALHAFHEAQAWRLAWWRLAREKLSYRRFFEIADLIGVRQEMRRVFRDSHRTIYQLARERRLDGIRIDHVDGVADPKGYLAELAAGFEALRRDVAIHVEKILTGPERLRKSWNIAGTTGYEFITAVSGLYVDGSQEEAMTRAYAEFVGGDEDLRAMIADQKRAIFTHNLAGELQVLTETAMQVAASDLETRDFGRDDMSRSIVEVATALPVYRTYCGVAGVPEDDIIVIDETVERAKGTRKVEADEPIDFVGRLLKLNFEDGRDVTGALNFTRRFQQTTGAVMAKAVEDTVFYRYNRLIALNEVGGEPDHYGSSPERFHEDMAIRLEDQPEGLMASSTHDTKRGEDARARLYTLSEAPERWAALVKDMAEAMQPWRKTMGDPAMGDSHVSPDPATEWGFYQSLLGVIPADFDPADAKLREELESRLLAFAEKAVREAKRYTSWTAPNEAYESALKGFVSAILSQKETGDLLARFWKQSQSFVVAGALNSLSQTLIKLTAPGVPDIYQGTEFYDLSLVDPDNRRKIDFAARQRAMEDGETIAASLPHWRDGRVKAKLTAAALKARIRAPELFTKGRYIPLEVTGAKADHVVAFARTDNEGHVAVTIAPRLALQLLGEGADIPMLEASEWGDTAVRLPSHLAGARFEDILASREVGSGASFKLADILSEMPVALLLAD
ncbi:alpha-amylase [Aureimonas ureilytica]|uniref:Alpha-amylase n=1 Tax=Aureimonas ureilytica TaxID=401562 RepID=A0A175RXU6_9HYPH|nr:malto-oligosyltrehalose synthase [Aureimonas ureilytica]KTR07649.1 alpha-amylase [Aureimonas ureilytica]